MTFSFKAVTSQGERKGGFIEANTLGEAKFKLKQQGLMILSLRRKSSLLRWRKNRLSRGQLQTLTSQLATLLSAGLPLYESLMSIAEESKGERYHIVLVEICEKIRSGEALSSAIGSYKESFPPLYIAMIRAGESAGALAFALERLSLLLQKQNTLKKQLVTTLVYPCILLVFSSLLVLLLLLFVIPSLEPLFEDRKVGVLTRALIGISHFFRHFGYLLPLFFAALVTPLFLFVRRKGKGALFTFFVKIPFISSLLIQKEVARFSRAMTTLLQGGVNIISALQIARNVLSVPPLVEEIATCEKRVIEGSLLSRELKKSQLFPPLFSRMLAIGEESGKMAEMLEHVADIYEKEVEKTSQLLLGIAQPAILLIMGGVVGVIMMAILLPLTDVHAFIGG